MIKAYLKNRTKYRGKGVDVRTDGGYVVGPPSVVGGVPYQVSNDARPIDMPASLVEWLLEGGLTKPGIEGKTKAPKPTTGETTETSTNYDFDLSHETALAILNELEGKYLTNFSDWFLVAGILKKHDLKQTWDQWSKQAASYSETKNEQIWQARTPCLDINYLV